MAIDKCQRKGKETEKIKKVFSYFQNSYSISYKNPLLSLTHTTELPLREKRVHAYYSFNRINFFQLQCENKKMYRFIYSYGFSIIKKIYTTKCYQNKMLLSAIHLKTKTNSFNIQIIQK